MSKLGKSENVLEAKWSIDYLVIDLDDKVLCLLHNDTIVVIKNTLYMTLQD